MKNIFFKPGFEFIFSVSLMAILGLPPMLMAQDQQNLEIKIENGDTTVNGKNIKELSAADRKSALRDIRHISADIAMNNEGPGKHRVIMFKRRDTLGGDMHNGGRRHMVNGDVFFKRDSAGNMITARINKRRVMTMDMKRQGFNDDKRELGPPYRDMNDGPGGPMMRFERRRNTQNFNYNNTDNDGISTRVSFHVAEASDEDLARMPHVEGGKMDISDLNIIPQFSTGKTLLMFNLPAKTIAEVKLVTSDGKLIWADKAMGGSFSKTFALGLNGIYYLQVKQGNSITVKRIMKND